MPSVSFFWSSPSSKQPIRYHPLDQSPFVIGSQTMRGGVLALLELTLIKTGAAGTKCPTAASHQAGGLLRGRGQSSCYLRYNKAPACSMPQPAFKPDIGDGIQWRKSSLSLPPDHSGIHSRRCRGISINHR